LEAFCHTDQYLDQKNRTKNISDNTTFLIEINNLKQLIITVSVQLKMITLGQHKSDNNKQMIRLTDAFTVLFNYT